jgi:hypothetical protein
MSLFDFNFYSGGSQPHEVSLLEKTLPTLIGLLLGFGLNRGYEFLRERRSIKRAGEEFINELLLFVEPLEKQLASLENAVDQLKDPKIRTFILEANIPVDADRIKAIDRLHVYKFFLKRFKYNTKESRKVVNKLYGLHMVCSMETDGMKGLLMTFNKDRGEDVLRLNNSLNGLMGAFVSIVLKIEKEKIDPKTDEFYSALKPFFDNFEKVNQMTPYEIIPTFCEPLIQLCALHRFDERSEIFSTHLRESYASYKDYVADRDNFIFHLEHISKALTKRYEELKSILSKKELMLGES